MPYKMRNPERFAKISAIFVTVEAKRRLDAERDRRSLTRVTPYSIAELIDELVVAHLPEAPAAPDPPKRKPAQRQRGERARSAAG
jgi:hypothetical protein